MTFSWVSDTKIVVDLSNLLRKSSQRRRSESDPLRGWFILHFLFFDGHPIGNARLVVKARARRDQYSDKGAARPDTIEGGRGRVRR